jgi:hypothetical protein
MTTSELANYATALAIDAECDCHTRGRGNCSAANDGFLCTRPLGHDGEHVACGEGETEHRLHVWRDK